MEHRQGLIAHVPMGGLALSPERWPQELKDDCVLPPDYIGEKILLCFSLDKASLNLHCLVIEDLD